MAKEFGQRPSGLMRGSWTDFLIDWNVMIAGREEEARRQDPKAARTASARQSKPQPGQFASPSGLTKYTGKGVNVKTMSVPETGVW